ncbi:MAG: gluconate 2-dehydrogenase subunit 3 family protein [Gemmatimonadales bacterium]
MDRRDVIRLAGVGLPGLAGLDPERIFAIARAVHRRASASRSAAFDEHQRATVDAIAELIMPATDTPGAHAAGVAAFIEVIVAEWYHDDERSVFMSDLAEVDTRSARENGKTFLEMTPPQQTALLTALESESRAAPRGAPQSFFGRIKDLTLSGYYTSEIGVRQELGEVFMPGRYDGAAPVRTSRAAAPGGH